MAFDLGRWLFGSSPEMKQAPTMTDQQQQFQNMLLNMLGAPTGSGFDYLQQILSGDEEAFKAFEDPIKRQFEQEVVPGIAERFAGLGSGGAQNSSAMQQTLGRAGTELSQNLAQLRAGLKSDALSQLQGLMGFGQQQAFQPAYDPGGYGVVGGFLTGAGEGAGQALGKAGMNYFLG